MAVAALPQTMDVLSRRATMLRDSLRRSQGNTDGMVAILTTASPRSRPPCTPPRAPELLLGAKEYSTAIDMWSLGCIMAELLSKEALFNGKKEIDQLDKIFKMLGTPNLETWPGYSKLPGVKCKFVKQPYNRLRDKFPAISFTGGLTLSEAGFDLLNRLLTYDPEKPYVRNC